MLAIVPVRGRDGKTRLDGFLAPEERARLVDAMLMDVVAACAGAASVDRVLVVTPDREAAPRGLDVLVDEGAGHEEAIAYALMDARARGGALVIMADCPLVSPESLDRLANAADPIALAPARDGGMNALALEEPDAVDPVFGVPAAAAETVKRARMRATDPAVLDEPGLAFDVLEPNDVWELREHGRGTRAHEVLELILPPHGGPR
ncbi:MAG: 2-phospho-L-lactate guanylyltransferase [Actinobacteria bacterium]|nr:2-phospho-L-lactate guanylyltransferase [Actinomycetota bacterium]